MDELQPNINSEMNGPNTTPAHFTPIDKQAQFEHGPLQLNFKSRSISQEYQSVKFQI